MHAHGLEDLLNFYFEPATDAEQRCFLRKSKWMYLALTFIIETFHGRAIVEQYRNNQDARSVLFDLVQHHTNSTVGVIAADDLLEFLTSDVLDSAWNKPYAEYITRWNTKAISYNEMVDHDLSEALLKTMLQKAVRYITPLRQVKNDDSQNAVRGLPPLTYSAYYTLLLSASQTQDEIRRGKGKRTVNVTDFVQDDEEEAVAHLIHNVERKDRPRLPDSLFRDFSSEDRQLWISMSDAAKQKVVARLVPSKPAPGRSFSKRPPRRSVNLADVEEDSSSGTDDDDDHPDVPSADITAHEAKTKTSAKDRSVAFKEAHPADVRRALSPRNPQPSAATRKSVKGYNVSVFADDDDDSSGSSSDDSLHLPTYDIHALEADDYADDTSSEYLSDDSDFWHGD